MSVEFYLARRYLFDHRHGAWGWLISSIATGSVALGVAALIVTLAIMTGFRHDIRQKMLGVHPHVLLTSFTGKMDPQLGPLQQQLDQHPEVKNWAPFVYGQILMGRGKLSSGATIKGIDPQKEIHVSHIKDRLVLGDWSDLTAPGEEKGRKPPIILGQELARAIGARQGDVVWLIPPSSIGITSFSIPRAYLFEVKGLLKTGLYDLDSVLAFTHLNSAQDLFNYNSQISGYGASLHHFDQAEGVAKELQRLIEGPYWVRSWISQNKNLFSALKLERTVMFLILAMLTVVAAFMIVSNLLLNITQKVKEIGILRAMGATSQVIRKAFLFQGAMMAIIGNVIGVILGLGISFFLAKTNIIRLPADVYYIDQLPIKLLPLDVVTVVFLSIFIVMLATFYPANKAAQLDPLDAIRYG